MGNIFLFALVAAANPTLLAAVTVMLFLPSPKRLLLGYLVGALLTSITIGLVIVLVIHDSSATSTAKHAVSPSLDIAFGMILLLVAYVLWGGHDQRLKERRRQRKLAKNEGGSGAGKPSQVEALLGRGSIRVTFALGAVLSLPSVSYLAALHNLQELGYGAGAEILVIVGFNLILLILLEVPLLGYFVAPERTVAEVERFRAWLTRSGRSMAIYGSGVLGLLLIGRGLIGYFA